MSTDLEELYGLRDKVALLSGGAGGIAQGLARALSALKVRLAIMDINSEGLERVVCELESNGAEMIMIGKPIIRGGQASWRMW